MLVEFWLNSNKNLTELPEIDHLIVGPRDKIAEEINLCNFINLCAFGHLFSVVLLHFKKIFIQFLSLFVNNNKCFESFYSGNSRGVQNIKSQKIMVRSDAGTVVQF